MTKIKLVNEMLSQLSNEVEVLRSPKLYRSISFKIFLALCLNAVLAPVVFAASGETISRGSAYAIGVLALVTVALAIYLFMVMLQPQRF